MGSSSQADNLSIGSTRISTIDANAERLYRAEKLTDSSLTFNHRHRNNVAIINIRKLTMLEKIKPEIALLAGTGIARLKAVPAIKIIRLLIAIEYFS